jgi:ubiquinone/menaquinone biosynthesis C-methylase UbiE
MLTPMAEDAPSPQRARELYRERAARYDRRIGIRAIAPVRRRVIARLSLRPGDTVIDVACGTGINFAAIIDAIGTGGRLIGVELSPEMLAMARDRVASAGWTHVELIQSPIENADLPGGADAALFSFTHDVLRSPDATARVVSALRPEARVVAAGTMAPWRWAAAAGPLLRRAARAYVTTTEGLERPWSHLAERVRIDRIERPRRYLGSMYIASGVTS